MDEGMNVFVSNIFNINFEVTNISCNLIGRRTTTFRSLAAQ